jgi:hypothetical protein
LPFSTLTEWAAGLRAPSASDGELDGALADDRKTLRERVFALVARPEVREALVRPFAVARREPEAEGRLKMLLERA